MATMANLTVKKLDGTTDIVYSAVVPSGGDGVDAIWRQDSGNTAPLGLRPLLKHRARDSGDKKSRVSELNGIYPFVYTDSTTGLMKSNGSVRVKIMVTVDSSLPYANAGEGAYQLLNAAAAPLVKQAIVEGWAPQ